MGQSKATLFSTGDVEINELSERGPKRANVVAGRALTDTAEGVLFKGRGLL